MESSVCLWLLRTAAPSATRGRATCTNRCPKESLAAAQNIPVKQQQKFNMKNRKMRVLIIVKFRRKYYCQYTVISKV